MDLILTVVECPAHSNMLNHTKVFKSTGGMVGRAETCDWVLSDTDRLISSRHFEVSFNDEVFAVIDHSTNGTFVNDAPNPLGGGTSYQLKAGDVLVCGEYHLRISLKAPAQPLVPNDLGAVDFLDSSDRTTFSAGIAEKQSDLSAAQELDAWLSPSAGKQPPLEQWGSSKVIDDASFLKQNFDNDPLKALGQSGQSNMLANSSGWDDEWWSDEGSFSDQASAVQQSIPSSHFEFNGSVDNKSQNVDELLGLLQPTEPISPIKKIEPTEPKVESALPETDNSELINTLVKELGLQDLSPNQKQSLIKDVSGMLNESIARLIDLLRARTTIKNELRVQHTLIQSSNNNPLKFSGNSTEAMRLLFGGGLSSFMNPVEAIKDGFDDLSDHQLAVLQAMQKSYEYMFHQFDPFNLTQQLSVSSSVWAGADAKKWKAYEQYFSSLKNDYETTYNRLFGEAFAKEYEKKLAELKGDRALN